MTKEFGLVGLGKMGANMARRMTEQGWRVVGWNRTVEVAKQMESEGLVSAESLSDLVSKLATPRVIWLMVPAGQAVDDMLFGETGLAKLLQTGDTVIDGGNSLYKDAAPRAEKLKSLGIHYMDCGTSGGPAGARRGACLMIGGQQTDFETCESLFKDFALPSGYQFFDGHGAGHFVKMIHNGIEYGMMQAIAEGFAILQASPMQLDLMRVTDIYSHGSVIESRLVSWMKTAFEARGVELSDVTSTVAHTGEGAWTVDAAKELHIPAPVIEASLEFRKASATNPSYTAKLLSALREQFGGHSVK